MACTDFSVKLSDKQEPFKSIEKYEPHQLIVLEVKLDGKVIECPKRFHCTCKKD